MDIESFEEKSWRNPGVDITDYFNFDLNEDSWKEYCNSLVSEVVLIPISHASLLDPIWVFWRVEIYFPKLSMQGHLWVCHKCSGLMANWLLVIFCITALY